MRRVTHLDAHQEAVKLGFRQRVSAVVLHGILRGDDEERLRERLRFAVHTDLRFVHGLEERGLRARRGAVDFIGQHDVGKNRPVAEFKLAVLGIVDADAKHVARKQIRSELNPLEAAMKRFGKRLCQRGLADARYVFDKQVAPREQRDERKLDGLLLAEDGAPNGALQLRNDLCGSCRHLSTALRLSFQLKTRALPATNR